MATRVCKKCGDILPLNRENFGHTDSGTGFRYSCRRCMSTHSKEYFSVNRDKRAANDFKRASNLRNAPGKYSNADIERIQAELDNHCFYCGEYLWDGFEIDHIIPISRKGRNDSSNITLACRLCNGEKYDKTAVEYYEWRLARNYKCGPALLEYIEL